MTPPGEGGISVIALSGPKAGEILESCFAGTRRRALDIAPGAIAHGRIVRDETLLDEVIVAHFDPSRSPTGELLYEVNCHGGAMAAQAVLGRLREAGAQTADWADMIRGAAPEARTLSPHAIRAAVLAALPRAQTRLAVRMLLHQAGGALSGELEAVRRELSRGEHPRLQALLDTAPLGEGLLGPPTVMLAGPPNVGKSTLLNALLRRERVIVHSEPGTTRDVVRETVSVKGVPFELVDAAGIVGSARGVDADAVRRAIDVMGKCDVALLLFDARLGPVRGLSRLPAPPPSARRILVGNKVDLMDASSVTARLPASLDGAPLVFVSAREDINLGQLETALLQPYRSLLGPCEEGGPVIFSRQIREALERVATRLAEQGHAGALRELDALC